jgi:hypothetical protein
VVVLTITTYRKVGAFYIACNGDITTAKQRTGLVRDCHVKTLLDDRIDDPGYDLRTRDAKAILHFATASIQPVRSNHPKDRLFLPDFDCSGWTNLRFS